MMGADVFMGLVGSFVEIAGSDGDHSLRPFFTLANSANILTVSRMSLGRAPLRKAHSKGLVNGSMSNQRPTGRRHIVLLTRIGSIIIEVTHRAGRGDPTSPHLQAVGGISLLFPSASLTARHPPLSS